METTDKLQQLIDRLLVKTQEGLCDWKLNTQSKLSLHTHVATIYLYFKITPGTDENIVYMEIAYGSNRDLVITTCKSNMNNKQDNLVRLFDEARKYHEDDINKQVDKIINEVQKLGTF